MIPLGAASWAPLGPRWASLTPSTGSKDAPGKSRTAPTELPKGAPEHVPQGYPCEHLSAHSCPRLPASRPLCPGINMMCGAAVPTQPICTLVTRTRDHATTPRTLFEHRKIVRTPGTLFEHCVVVSSNTKTICTEMFEHRKIVRTPENCSNNGNECSNTRKLFEHRKRVFEHRKIVRTPKRLFEHQRNCSNTKTCVRTLDFSNT